MKIPPDHMHSFICYYVRPELYTLFLQIRGIMLGVFSRDQLSLSNCGAYCDPNSLDKFLFFADEVPLEQSKWGEESAIRKLSATAEKLYEHHGIKALRPLKTLLMRMLDNSWGYTDAHGYFISLCKKHFMPNEALSMIEYPTFCKTMKRNPMVSLHLDSCDVLIMLKKYQKAYEVINRAQKIPCHDEERLILLLSRFTVLSLYMGKEVTYEFKETVKAHLTALFRDNERRTLTKIDLGKIQEMVDFYLQLTEWRQLKESQVKLLKDEGLLEVYQASRYRSLGNYIEAEVKQQNWRVKASDIKNVNIGDFKVMSSINSPQQVYKYDSGAKTMYFNHKRCDQEKLNNLISTTLLMEREVANCKIETRGLDRGMGGMGGGGMGMMGGLMGMMGGMMGRGGRGGRDPFDDMM